MNQSPPPPSSVPTKANAPTAQAIRAADLLTYQGSAYPHGSVAMAQDVTARIVQNAEVIDSKTHLPALLAVVEAAERFKKQWNDEAVYLSDTVPDEKSVEVIDSIWDLEQSVAAYRAAVGTKQT